MVFRDHRRDARSMAIECLEGRPVAVLFMPHWRQQSVMGREGETLGRDWEELGQRGNGRRFKAD
jgi:hypothetical protein